MYYWSCWQFQVSAIMRPTHVNGRYSTTFRLPSSGGSRTDSLDTLTRPVTLAAFVTDICFKR